VTLRDTLETVVSGLRDAGIDHMVAGSVASTMHGEPRSTQDVDLIIDPSSPDALDQFVSRFDSARFYVGSHRAAYAQRGMFNVIDLETGWKIDLILRRDRPFSRTEMARRRPATIEGVTVDVASPEDIILSKLEWAALGESTRQLDDVRAVIRATRDHLDIDYLTHWAHELGVANALQRALDTAG